MISVVAQWDKDVISAIREEARDHPRQVKLLVGQIARGPLAQQCIAKLGADAPKPHYPLDWQTPKQRRYVMMTLKRTKNLPYKRTGRIRRGWRVVVVSAANAEIAIENNERGVRFVQGDDQQRMHLGRWPAAAPIIVETEAAMQDALIDGWYRITKAGK